MLTSWSSKGIQSLHKTTCSSLLSAQIEKFYSSEHKVLDTTPSESHFRFSRNSQVGGIMIGLPGEHMAARSGFRTSGTLWSYTHKPVVLCGIFKVTEITKLLEETTIN